MSSAAGNAAGNAAAPEDTATAEVSSERPGLESGDPGSADSGTSTPESADRGVQGSAGEDGAASGGRAPETEAAGTEVTGDDESDEIGDASGDAREPGDGGASEGDGGGGGADPTEEGFVSGLLRDSTVTGLPGETGTPPAEPHAPQAQQQGDEPVGSEPPAGDNPRGVD
jgi:hypothetical protein